MPKTSLRRELLERRRQLSEDEICRAGTLIQRRFTELPEFVAAPVVALYSAVHSEVETAAIFSAARQAGKTVAFPRTQGLKLEFGVVEELGQLQPGRYGLAEPVSNCAIALDDIALMAVPGVAFDRNGGRLGYGKGYYDRCLAGLLRRPYLVGLCYDFQLLDLLPKADHDVHMDLVVTEAGVLRLR